MIVGFKRLKRNDQIGCKTRNVKGGARRNVCFLFFWIFDSQNDSRASTPKTKSNPATGRARWPPRGHERGEVIEDMKDQGAGANMLSPSLQPTASRIWRKHLATADRVQREDGTSGANASTSSLASGSEENEVSSVLRLRPKRSLDLTRTDGCECHSPLQPKNRNTCLPLSLSLYHTHIRSSPALPPLCSPFADREWRNC